MALQTETSDGKRRIQKTVTIRRTPLELYHAWRNVENFPRFMKHVESVDALDGRRSRWTVKAPAGQTVSWDAVIDADVEGELLSWHSVPKTGIDNAGSVHFKPAPAHRGTEVSVTLEYGPPGGTTGVTLAKMFGEEPSVQLDEDLHRFKQLMETGRIITTDGQPVGIEQSRGAARNTSSTASSNAPRRQPEPTTFESDEEDLIL